MCQTTKRDSETHAGTESLTESEYHRLMAVERRRTTLTALAELSDPVDLDDLAAAVVKREMGKAALNETSIEQIATELHHNHLPKMERLGVIDYEQDCNRIVACSEETV